jgi:NADH-ubiquinone oxidoreductase chain 1
LTVNVEVQKIVFFLFPLFPIFIIFFIGCIAETNRAPFDLAEAESELVSGFMTEHSASIFVFFFLAEYGSIVLICIFNSILFLGGYLTMFSLDFIVNLLYMINIEIDSEIENNIITVILQGITSSLMLGLKSSFMIFVFI